MFKKAFWGIKFERCLNTIFYFRPYDKRWSPKSATGLNVILGIDQKIYMSDQTVLLPKWSTPRGNILAKGQLGYFHTF